MGIFGNFFNESKKDAIYSCTDEFEGWIGILTAVSQSDGEMADSEMDSLLKMLLNNKKYYDFADENFMERYKHLLHAIEKGISWADIVKECVKKIQKEDINTIFAMAVELAWANGEIEKDEIKILEAIAKELEIDVDSCEKIIKVMGWRYKYNLLLN
jgi:tellurite resistance protein